MPAQCCTRDRLGIVGALALLTAIPANAAVIVNEILYHADAVSPDPMCQHEWVELYNAGNSDIDLVGWVIANRDGAGGPNARTLPSAQLPPGAYLVIHIASGSNDLDLSDGCGEYFTGDAPGSNLFDDGSDECGLYAGALIVDFAAWNFGDSGYVPGTAAGDAVAAGVWTPGAFRNTAAIANDESDMLRVVLAGTSLGRDQNGTDTDTPQDWDALGGRDAFDCTLCRQNLDAAYFVEFPEERSARMVASWTVMLYLSGDNDLEKYAYGKLKSIEHSVHGSDVNVNIVAMVDGQTMTRQAALDQNGNLMPLPGTGIAFRSRIGDERSSNYIAVTPTAGVSPNLGEVDMCDPQTLKGFISWARTNFPASHYALIVFAHGGGWKAWGPDQTNTGPHYDHMFMGEFSTALADVTGDNILDMLAFDSCLMGMIEVASQVESHCHHFVGHEQISWAEMFPYELTLPQLKTHASWTGRELGTRVVDDYAVKAAAGSTAVGMYTIACVDEGRLPELMTKVSQAAGQLRGGCDDFQTHDTPKDNVEDRLRAHANKTQRFHDENYMDLRHFAQLVEADRVIPNQYKTALRGSDGVIALSRPGGPVVIAEKHGSGYGRHANGLTIYMPQVRTVAKPTSQVHDGDDAYDYPSHSRLTDGASQRAMYALNNDCLPQLAVNVEDPNTALAAPSEWPLVPTPSFRFAADTDWDEFLLRYYHPVADNHILKATGLDCNGKQVTITPKVNNWPTPDEITIYPGFTVHFSAKGSTDADTSTERPIHWMWDFDNHASACGASCIAPYEVPSGADAATAANDDMNAEHDCDKAPLTDEKEVDEKEPTHVFSAIGDYVVTLHVWDDNHTFKYHDTRKAGAVDPQGAKYAHPQTDDHVSIVHVVPCPPAPPCPPTPPATPRTPENARPSDRTTYRTVESFTSTQDSIITGGCWWGTYDSESGDCGGLYPDSFTVRYYQDAGGLPGPVMAEFSQADGTLTVTLPQATGLLIANALPEYLSTGIHEPFTVPAGVCTWIEITNGIPECTWLWEDAAGDDRLSLQAPASQTGYSLDDIVTADRAVSLAVEELAPSACLPPPPPNDECSGAILLPNGLLVNVGNEFATTTLDEPAMSCLPGSARGAGTVWFAFVAEDTSARVSVCASGAAYAVLAIYEGPCEQLIEVGLDDDTCGPGSSTTATGLLPGQLYFVKLASRDDTTRGLHQVQLLMPAPPPLLGDVNGDGVIDIEDFDLFAVCLHGPDVFPPDGCEQADLSDDSDVDLADFAEFQQALGAQ